MHSDNVVDTGVVTLTATFSKHMGTIAINFDSRVSDQYSHDTGSSSTIWTYFWPVPSSVTTGTYAVTVAATDTAPIQSG